ncbi:hypothetical protein OU787_03700 [Kitasatospora sp. YST-16]|uniref:hypothetical protein n=1 Tax=Kitasatospora sp. YST-16 TaxID=2998080 RepID=UPI0022853218|nr:hypothetical protein [Kitasatospora sp. YST-16]WAL70676.1 hypothetical protein OU787_03700 [Kitasatospora sp. YST-16]WNW36719.1 hypothetical protein RKE32_03690 [Streptomyces sp. Li-HN-5-13]
MKISFRLRSSRALALTAALAVLLGTALAVLLRLQSGDGTPAKVAANDYSGRPSVCLAADDSTASAQLVQHTWAVLQQSGTDSGVNVQQLVVPAEDAAEAAPYLSGLVAQHCTMVVTAGAPFDGALPTVAKDAPHVRFIAVDPPAGTDLKGATALPPDQVPDRLGQSVRDLVTKH